MNFPVIFDVVIGIVVVYFISSICLSFITNYIISRRNWKGEFLYEQLQHIFSSTMGSNSAFVERLYKHPLIDSLKQYYYRKPEKIEADIFAQTMLAVIQELDQEVLELREKEWALLNSDKNMAKDEESYLQKKLEFENLIAQEKFRSIKINNEFIDGKGRILLSTLLNDVNNNTEGHDKIKNWFLVFQDRTQFLFSRLTKWYLFIYALIFCIILNVDTIKIYKTLYLDETARDRMVVLATDITSKDQEAAIKSVQDRILMHIDTTKIDTVSDTTYIKVNIEQITQIQSGIHDAYGDANFLIWWKKNPWNTFTDLYEKDKSGAVISALVKLLGILISSFALMYGAPFWYDIMRKMVTVRQTINTK
ncbi:MAG: hypothetical protein IPN97_06930 [Saprospiraceae bacterium]|nr:hypothetical protein [Saprospiraceae bacterium]